MQRAVRSSPILVAVVWVLVSFAALAADVHTKSRFDLSSQPLAKALNAFAVQAGINIYFDPPSVAGLESPALKAELTAGDALTRLLAGTRLKAVYVNENTVRVVSIGALSTEVSAVEQQAALALQLAQSGEQSEAERKAGSVENLRNPQTQSPQAAAESSAERLQEIIVTATKRAENIQDVPASIAAVTAEEIDRRGLVSGEDYLRGIPGVNQVTHTTGASIVIRGIETSPQSQNFSSGTTVATYFGETPTTNSGGLSGGTNVDLKLVDIERVEVLRGPQGTAFGNSSLGGAVRTIPVAPKLDRFEGKVGANYSVTSGSGGDNHMMQAVGNIPLIKDKLAIRATAYQFQDTGFYRNVAGSDAAFQTAIVARYGAQAYAVDQDEVGSSKFIGGRIAALFQASDNLKFTLGYVNQKTEVDGQAEAGGQAEGSGYDQVRLQVAPETVVRGQKGGVFDTQIEIANATMEYDFGWASLLATFSHTDSGSTYSVPATNSAYSQDAPGEHRERNGELRLTTQFAGAWNFLGGLYAEELDDDILYDYWWFGDPARSPFGLNRHIGEYFDVRNLKQKAAFTEVSWEFLPGFTLTGGMRAYDYERVARVTTTGALFGTAVSNLNADASGTSLRGNLSYKIKESGLLYADWSQGFRLGKPQPGLPPGLCDLNNDGFVDGGPNVTVASTKILESDEVDNYELGAKFTLLDRRLTISADVYRIDWTGVPFRVVAPAPPDGCGLAYNANAGGARSEGVELQANFYVTRAFRVDVGGSSIRAALTKDAPALNAFEDDRLPGSPKLNANLALQYEFDIGGHETFVRADSIYVGPFYGDLQQTALTESGGYVKVDATARIAIGNLNVDLFVHNLTDQDDFTFRGIANSSRGSFFGYRLRPRTIGIQLGYHL